MPPLLLTLVAALACAAQAKLPTESSDFQNPSPQPVVFARHDVAQVSLGNRVLAGNSSETYGIYSSKEFARGRGISIITQPGHMDHFYDLAPLASGVNDLSSAPFEEREIPGKGRGIIATKMLYKGDRIFAHTPILLIHSEVVHASEESAAWLQEEAVSQLPPESQSMFWKLYGQPVYHPVSARVNVNAFGVRIEDATYYGVFPEIARMNHDCRPNAAFFTDEATLTHYVHAITDIAPGTEISITYLDSRQKREQRAKQLEDSWGFECSCSSCILPSHLSRASDQRLAQINKLKERLKGDGWRTASSKMAETLLHLYEQERLHAAASRAYRWAALTFCAEGNYWETVRYANIAVEVGILAEGFRDKDVLAMHQLVDNPQNEECWMLQQT